MDHATGVPTDFSFHLLEEITNGFSEERELGSGGYGKVYMGVHNGQKIAVKMLYDMPGLDDEQQFQNEFNNLTSFQHHNIVRLVGYCYEAQKKYIEYNGKMVFIDKIYRALCFEYMQNGSLDNYLYDEYNGHDWHTRYAIIKGICKGLKYLHEELESPIYHLDLKPANVLLDENMLPKIADFGLSRLFGEEQTRITKNCIGTLGYLPPEYIERNVISNKLDIFSLGVVIIKIMTGPKGYSKRSEMTSQQFIELVHGNWRNRLHATSVHGFESYSEQVKRCIEIALSCVEADRHKRPSIGNIVNKLNETETTHEVSQFPHALRNDPGSSIDQDDSGSANAIAKLEGYIEEQNKIIRTGPWGGNTGEPFDITVAPQCLHSITIRSGEVIISLAFSYSDDDGKQQHAGPWGSYDGCPDGTFDTIQLGPSEFLTEISGTIGLCTKYSCDVVTSLTFITNARSYGPFGGGKGITFHSPVLSDACIVGFFAHTAYYVDAIGVYLNLERETIKGQTLVTKIGPWGGHGGGPHDVKVSPRRLISVVVRSGKVIDSLAFTYSDCDGKQRTAGPWGLGGPHGGSFDTILLRRSEFLKEVSGTIGPSPDFPDVVTSLLFVTNAGSYGPYGEGGGTPFRSPVQANGSIVGFFARAGTHVDAIGVYVG